MQTELIQCVVVLYRCSPDDSSSLVSLSSFFEGDPQLARSIALLIYDNSPESHRIDLSRWNCAAVEYHHDPENGGLAPAYNSALARAQQKGIEWLLLLDQDTMLNAEYFLALFSAVRSALPEKVCALVPKLIQEGKVLSPQAIGHFRNASVSAEFTGIHDGTVTAFNSAACMKVQFVASVGGFAPEYPLAFLDHIMFYRLRTAGGQVLVLNAQLEHDLTLTNLESKMSVERYQGVLNAEWRFIRETGMNGGPLAHRLRLLRRAIRQAAGLRNKGYAFRTLRATVQ